MLWVWEITWETVKFDNLGVLCALDNDCVIEPIGLVLTPNREWGSVAVRYGMCKNSSGWVEVLHGWLGTN